MSRLPREPAPCPWAPRLPSGSRRALRSIFPRVRGKDTAPIPGARKRSILTNTGAVSAVVCSICVNPKPRRMVPGLP